MRRKSISIKLFGALREAYELGIKDYIPVFQEGNAGADVRSTIGYITLKPGEHIKIPLGFGLELQQGTYARVEGRSGNAAKFGIDTIGNIIDPSYRGEIHAILVNNGQEDFVISQRDRIAQIVISDYIPVNFFVTSELTETERGEKGFGSSGIK